MPPNPQERYENKMQIKTLTNGRKVYSSLRPVTIYPDPFTDVSILSTDTARMDVVSFNLYGSVESWWKIASINGKVNGSLYFEPGTQIILPKS